jgi:hypothetical protein
MTPRLTALFAGYDYEKQDHLLALHGEALIETLEAWVVLAHVVSDAYIQEGCDSPGELIAVWEQIHPGVGYEPDKIVWAHCWKELS